MNRLKGLGCYLSGPIDYAKDNGSGWREDLSKFLESRNVKVFNPLDHHFDGAEEVDTVKKPTMEKMREEGRFSEIRDEMKDIIHWDLRALDLSSFLVVNYDIETRMAGTLEEMFLANTQTKPVLLMVGSHVKELSTWIFGRFPYDHMFSSWDQLKDYLIAIDSKDVAFSDADRKRWLFLNGDHMKED